MSTDRRRTGELPGHDCPEELSFAQFLEACSHEPIVRVQGRSRETGDGKLRRFNRALLVLPDSIRTTKRGRVVTAKRLRRKDGDWVPTGKLMTLSERFVDWCTWVMTGDPNGSWKKVED